MASRLPAGNLPNASCPKTTVPTWRSHNPLGHVWHGTCNNSGALLLHTCLLHKIRWSLALTECKTKKWTQGSGLYINCTCHSGKEMETCLTPRPQHALLWGRHHLQGAAWWGEGADLKPLSLPSALHEKSLTTGRFGWGGLWEQGPGPLCLSPRAPASAATLPAGEHVGAAHRPHNLIPVTCKVMGPGSAQEEVSGGRRSDLITVGFHCTWGAYRITLLII